MGIALPWAILGATIFARRPAPRRVYIGRTTCTNRRGRYAKPVTDQNKTAPKACHPSPSNPLASPSFSLSRRMNAPRWEIFINVYCKWQRNARGIGLHEEGTRTDDLKPWVIQGWFRLNRSFLLNRCSRLMTNIVSFSVPRLPDRLLSQVIVYDLRWQLTVSISWFSDGVASFFRIERVRVAGVWRV